MVSPTLPAARAFATIGLERRHPSGVIRAALSERRHPSGVSCEQIRSM
jgi:hypothetical protein